MRSRAPAIVLAAVTFAVTSAHTPSAQAEPPTRELMSRLAAQAAQYERMRTHASYAVAGHLDQIDGDGAIVPGKNKKLRAHVDADGVDIKVTIDEYIEDDEDQTSEAREKEAERRSDPKKREEAKKKQIKMPTLASEQGRYTFDVVAVDPADSSRVKIKFVPKPEERTETAIEGEAWVDSRAGTVLSAGFKLVKTSMWVDYVHIRVEFGAPTPLGPAVSHVTFEGKGGVLFFRRRFRGEATLSNYRIVP